jgi:hypothetical protein
LIFLEDEIEIQDHMEDSDPLGMIVGSILLPTVLTLATKNARPRAKQGPNKNCSPETKIQLASAESPSPPCVQCFTRPRQKNSSGIIGGGDKTQIWRASGLEY